MLNRLLGVVTGGRSSRGSDVDASGDEDAPPTAPVDDGSEAVHCEDGARPGSSSGETGSDAEALGDDPAHDELDELGPDPADGATTAAGAGRTMRVALAAGTLCVVVVGALIGYLGWRTHQSRVAADQRAVFLQAGRQSAINLTTISYTQADADVARILDSATGTFRDDFQKRSAPFIDVVKKAQSTSQGSVTAAGLESVDGDHASVIVAVSVKTTNAGAPKRAWRMRITVEKVADTAKASDVQFVP